MNTYEYDFIKDHTDISVNVDLCVDDYVEVRAAACSLGYLDLQSFIKEAIRDQVQNLWDEGIMSNSMMDVVRKRVSEENL